MLLRDRTVSSFGIVRPLTVRPARQCHKENADRQDQSR